MRIGFGAIVLASIAVIPLPAVAEDFASCWVAEEIDRYGVAQTVTRCRIAGGDVVDYASDDSVPSRLYPSAGIALDGSDCWYLTSTEGQWIYLGLYINGDASLGWMPDPDFPDGIMFATGRIPRCTSEPGVIVDPSAEVWAYVTAYLHQPPAPDVNPGAGDGVTGLETFVGVPIPADHAAQLAAGGVTVDIEIEVSGVIIDWGDGRAQNFPASEAAMVGYPDGIARHVYETKGDDYDLAVSYDWTARWRIIDGPWELLDVPNTTTSIAYPVNEIVSVITD